MVRGEVQDDQDYALGGIAGCDGAFSTAKDIAVFCQMILNGGRFLAVSGWVSRNQGGEAVGDIENRDEQRQHEEREKRPSDSNRVQHMISPSLCRGLRMAAARMSAGTRPALDFGYAALIGAAGFTRFNGTGTGWMSAFLLESHHVHVPPFLSRFGIAVIVLEPRP